MLHNHGTKVFKALFLTLMMWFSTSSLGLGGEGLSPEHFEKYMKIGNLLRCPTCTGLSVMESEASFSKQIRESVREQVELGKSEEEIMLFFQERYGMWIFREPPKKGIHLIAWAGPVAVVLIGAYLIWALVWRRRKTFSTYGVRGSQDILKEMDENLEKMRKEGAKV